MPAQLDHLVCVTPDITAARKAFATAGLDDTDIELVARRRAWLRTPYSGLTQVVLRVDDLDAAVTALRAAGFLPDDPDLPVLIQDTGDMSERSAARAIAKVAITVEDPARVAEAYAALLPGNGTTFKAGHTTLELRAGPRKIEATLTGSTLPAEVRRLGLDTSPDVHEAAERLAAALRLRTVSYEDPAKIEQHQFKELGAHLERSFPRVHAELGVQVVGHSRLYRWTGTDADAQPAAILLAHMDVVPVDDTDGWTHPPFDGVIADGYVWGRGAIDDKSRVVALLEAVEGLLAEGHRPARTIYLAFGHDEEIGGLDGAHEIAAILAEQGVRAEFLLDEGGGITTGVIDGARVPVASIMVGEKGFVTVRLSTSDLGGHSSMPPDSTAVGRLARAVAAVQDHPMPLRATPTVIDMVRRLAPVMPLARRLAASQATRLGPLIARTMAAQPQSRSLVRTTTAPTVISGGVKANVLPQRAEALINFRILQGDTIDGVLEHCKKVIADDQVTVELTPGMRAEPSPIASTGSPAFELIAGLAAEALPGCAVTTGIVPGATDARHYHDVCEQRFNFAPVLFDSADLQRIHGTDERISLANYARLIDFNTSLLRRL